MHMHHPAALKRLESDQEAITVQLSELSKSSEACEVEMKGLKVALYAKFGHAINLDD